MVCRGACFEYQIENKYIFYNSLLSCRPRLSKSLIQKNLLSMTGSNIKQFVK